MRAQACFGQPWCADEVISARKASSCGTSPPQKPCRWTSERPRHEPRRTSTGPNGAVGRAGIRAQRDTRWKGSHVTFLIRDRISNVVRRRFCASGRPCPLCPNRPRDKMPGRALGGSGQYQDDLDETMLKEGGLRMARGSQSVHPPRCQRARND